MNRPTCYACAKTIKGEVTIETPPTFMIEMGLDFIKAFHPACYEKAEARAAAELAKAAAP